MVEKNSQNKICIVNEDCVYPNQTIYSLERQKIFSFKNKFTVKDDYQKKDLYVCELQQRGQNSIKSMTNDNNIVRFDTSLVKHFRIDLYSGNSNTGKDIKIKNHISLGNPRYFFEIYNKTTNKNEELEVYIYYILYVKYKNLSW